MAIHFILIVYMMLTLNVSINAHLKKEFKLTYAKLGPTEFRVLAIIFNTTCIFCPAITDSMVQFSMFGREMLIGSLDMAYYNKKMVCEIIIIYYLHIPFFLGTFTFYPKVVFSFTKIQ